MSVVLLRRLRPILFLLLAISVFFYFLVEVRDLAPNAREVVDALVALA